jgi:nitroreductase
MAQRFDPKVTPWQVAERDFLKDGTLEEKLKFLLSYAILAPSSHNTQPWEFAVGEDEIQVFIDRTRWLKVADPDRRELYISIGCALENLLIAAEHFGYGDQVTHFSEPDKEELVATVKFMPQGQPSPFREPALFEAIPIRHTNRKVYEDRPIPKEDLQRLQDCCVEEGIHLHMTDDPEIKRRMDELIVRGDAMQFADPAWREELGYWMGQGVFGTPWLMSKAAQLAVTYLNLGKGTAKKDSELLMSAPVLALLSSQANDRQSQVKVGQVFERICLTATTLGAHVHPMSQIVEIPELKDELAKLIPTAGLFPQHSFRLGYAEQEKEHTPRRPLEEVLV